MTLLRLAASPKPPCRSAPSLNAVVLLSPTAPRRTREAVQRALERFPVRVEEIALERRALRLRELAGEGCADVYVVVDDDAVPLPAAFAPLAHARRERPALVGGAAIVDGAHRFGASFGAPRSGPDPFELVAIAGIAVGHALLAAIRGPIDVPQRGIVIVEADFVRSLGDIALDPIVLGLDLAVQARLAGRAVVCEPAMTFTAREETAAVVQALGRHRRFAGLPCWEVESLHRDPPALRLPFIHREIRLAGTTRGYVRRRRPPLDVLLAGAATDGLAARRLARQLEPTDRVTVFAGDGDTVRRALAHTGDRYVFVGSARDVPDVTRLAASIERLERSAGYALAVETTSPPFAAALFHGGRIVGGAALRGTTAEDVIGAALEEFRQHRLFTVGPAGVIDATIAALAPPATTDVVFVAASKPEVMQQTVRTFVQEPPNGSLTAVYPAGNATIRMLLAPFADLRFEPDAVDPLLARGLNGVLAATHADVVCIVRDDVQVPRGVVATLREAFARIPRLGAVVPRISGGDRPEALCDVGYQNLSEMQALRDRRAVAFARESHLIEVATAPVLLVARAALDVVGGFDERFGFSRYGIADFTRRLRAANFLVAQCEDAYAHIFGADVSASLLGELDASARLRADYEARWTERAGFDPRRDRVELRSVERDATVVTDRLRLLVPIGSADEWERFRPRLAALAATLRVGDPVEIAIGLDGSFAFARALAAVREILVDVGVPLDETLNVAIEPAPDIAAWRDLHPHRVRLAGFERDQLAELYAIDDAASLRAFTLTAT